MPSSATIALISAIVAVAGTARAEDDIEPQLEEVADAHAAVAVETSGGEGEAALGFRALLSYDVLRGNGDRLRPALGLGVTIGGTGRDVEMSSKGIWDLGAMVVASLRFHRAGVVVDRRIFASAALLRDYGPMTNDTGIRYSVGGNWFAAAAEHTVAHPEDAWVWVLPHQIEAYYQHQLGDRRYGLAFGYGF
jgi:hypothetical protein